MSIQIFEENGQPLTVTMSYNEYTNLIDELESYRELEDAVKIREAVLSGEMETWPSEFVYRLSETKNWCST